MNSAAHGLPSDMIGLIAAWREVADKVGAIAASREGARPLDEVHLLAPVKLGTRA